MEKRLVHFFIITIFVNILLPFKLFSLDPSWPVTQYIMDNWNIERGLPQNTVYTILQTSDGYLWAGTEEGLVRFDGLQFTVFDSVNTPQLSQHNIRCLFEDSDGCLWIGTMAGGVVCYHNGRFSKLADEGAVEHLNIFDICQDEEGDIWIASDGGGLFRYNKKKKTCTHFGPDQGLTESALKLLYLDRKGHLWVGTISGLFLYENNRFVRQVLKIKGTGHSITLKEDEGVNTICEDSQNNFWIGTVGSLLRKDGDSYIKYNITGKDEEVFISEILEDKDHNIWISTHSAILARYKDNKFELLDEDDGFADNWLLALFEDQEGNIWIGTSYKGIFRLKDDKFITLTTRQGLTNNLVWSIMEDRQGNLWIGTNNGLNRYKDGVVTAFTTDDGLTNNSIDTLYEDSQGAIWAGTDSGLNRLPTPESKRFSPGSFRQAFNGYQLDKRYVPSILEDQSGAMWIGTLQGAVWMKDGQSKEYTHENGLGTRFVNFVHQDRTGAIWFCTMRKGLTRYKDGAFKIYTPKQGLASDTIICMYEDPQGVMWMGSASGLTRMENETFFPITKRHGLFNNNIFQILEDDNGYLWMSCNLGVFKVLKSQLNQLAKGKREKVDSIVYDKNDGMLSSECNGGYKQAGVKTRDGRLWFPTNKGATMIDPNNIKINRIPPAIKIERVLLDGQPVDLSLPIKLLPGVKRMEIHYTALSYVNPRQNQFKYRLEGYEDEWLNAGNRRTAFYTNLDGGTYTFKVKGSNNDEIWNESGASLEITVIPPFWRTYWFMLMAALAFAFVSYFVIHLTRKYINFANFWKKEKYIGKFKLIDKIGSGGMGTIYKANNLMEKNESVALKVLREDLFEDENSRKRFQQEGTIIDQLDHPNIVKIYERGQSGQTLFIAMELLEGENLARRIFYQKKLGLDEAVHIMLQISDALVKIHSKGIIHRDLKPENVMLITKHGDKNYVKLLDFGLAKMQHQTRLTQTGIVIGTINYMSPEQITGMGSFPESDIYSLGIIFYEMITGEKPFVGETTIDIMKQILDKTPIEPIRFRFDISFELNCLIMGMLEKKMEVRPNILEVLKKLRVIDKNLRTIESGEIKQVKFQ